MFTRDGLELVVVGCGGVARIPIQAIAPPIPTFEAIEDTLAGVRMAWTATPPQTSATVYLGGLGGTECHKLDETEHTFSGWSIADSGYLVAAVRTFEPVQEVSTDLGTARVWIGGLAYREPI